MNLIQLSLGQADFGQHNPLTQQAILNTVNKFEKTKSVTDIVRHVSHCNIRVEKDANMSIFRSAHHLGLSYGLLLRITHQLRCLNTMDNAKHTQIRWLNNKPLMPIFRTAYGDRCKIFACRKINRMMSIMVDLLARTGNCVRYERMLSDYF